MSYARCQSAGASLCHSRCAIRSISAKPVEKLRGVKAASSRLATMVLAVVRGLARRFSLWAALRTTLGAASRPL